MSPTAEYRPGTGRGGWAPDPGPDPGPDRVPAVWSPRGGRRRPLLLAGGVALAAVGGVAGVWQIGAAGHREPVLVMTRSVPVGARVQPEDIGVADVSLDPGVATIPADRRARLIGQVATTDLTAGALLAIGQIEAAVPPMFGRDLTVLALPVSRMPAIGLQYGDAILVVPTPAADADPPATIPDSLPASVVRVGTPDPNGLIPVDVTVAAGDGPRLAAWAATGRVAVVLRPSGES